MPRIIIAEDESNILLSLEFLLRGRGHEIAIATDGEDAMQLIMDRPPDLILLDIMLPRMSGFEICRRIRENEATRSVPVIMLSARGRQTEITRGLDAGADLYVTKPFSTTELMQHVDQLLTR